MKGHNHGGPTAPPRKAHARTYEVPSVSDIPPPHIDYAQTLVAIAHARERVDLLRGAAATDLALADLLEVTDAMLEQLNTEADLERHLQTLPEGTYQALRRTAGGRKRPALNQPSWRGLANRRLGSDPCAERGEDGRYHLTPAGHQLAAHVCVASARTGGPKPDATARKRKDGGGKRRMSFGLTQAQFLDGSKDVTRRMGWRNLQPGDRLLAVNKAMGLKRGETSTVFGEIEIVSVRRERLDTITDDDVRREGFPAWDAAGFVAFFCRSMRCLPDALVTRIEFRRI